MKQFLIFSPGSMSSRVLLEFMELNGFWVGRIRHFHSHHFIFFLFIGCIFVSLFFVCQCCHVCHLIRAAIKQGRCQRERPPSAEESWSSVGKETPLRLTKLWTVAQAQAILNCGMHSTSTSLPSPAYVFEFSPFFQFSPNVIWWIVFNSYLKRRFTLIIRNLEQASTLLSDFKE